LKTDWPIRIVVATWLIQVVMTYPAWIGGCFIDEFIFTWYHPIIIPSVSLLFVAALVALVVFENFRKLIYFLILLLLSVLFICNPHLLQPWQYTHALILGALVFNNRLFLTIILGGLYFWSGLNKLNPWFYDEVFCWFFSPFSNQLPITLSYIIPFLEMLSGVLLLFSGMQKSAAFFCIIKHGLIATLLSPLFLNWNGVVIPWNICLALLLFLIYYQPNPQLIAIRKTYITYFAIVGIWLAPAFWYVYWWPTPLSFHLYSGYHAEAYLIINTTSHDLNAMTQNIYGMPMNISKNILLPLHQKIEPYLPEAKLLYVHKVPLDTSKTHTWYYKEKNIEN
jgi:hypothetical protein